MKLKENSFLDRYLRSAVGIVLAVAAIGFAFAIIAGVFE